MTACRHPRTGTCRLIRLTVAGAAVWSTSIASAGLYECRNPAGAPIFTDSPAQLEHCQPVASGGTSQSAPQAPEPIPSYPPPEAPSPISPDPGSSAIASPGGLAPSGGYPAGVPGGSSEDPPCMPGINPLNPFSGPPCTTAPHTAPQPIAPAPTVSGSNQP